MIGIGPHLTGLTFPNQRQLIPPPRLDVPVECIKNDVGFAADKPFEKWLRRFVENLVPLPVPF